MQNTGSGTSVHLPLSCFLSVIATNWLLSLQVKRSNSCEQHEVKSPLGKVKVIIYSRLWAFIIRLRPARLASSVKSPLAARFSSALVPSRGPVMSGSVGKFQHLTSCVLTRLPFIRREVQLIILLLTQSKGETINGSQWRLFGLWQALAPSELHLVHRPRIIYWMSSVSLMHKSTRTHT